MTSTAGDALSPFAPVQQPQWHGVTYEVANERHLLPLYEDDRIHISKPGHPCPCNPVFVGTVFRDSSRFAPAISVYRHNNLTDRKQ